MGTLAETDRVELKAGQTTLKDFAAQLKLEHQQALQSQATPVFQKITIAFKGQRETYYSYCNTHRLANFGKQRLVINYGQADLSDNPTFFISNRLFWNGLGITRIRRHRWPVEVYHQEGKAEGLDQYQLRHFSAIQRHVALVAVVYSILRSAQHDPRLQEQLQRHRQRARFRRCLSLTTHQGMRQERPKTVAKDSTFDHGPWRITATNIAMPYRPSQDSTRNVR